MSIKIGDNKSTYLLKWDDINNELNILQYDYFTWSQPAQEYLMTLNSTKVLSYTTPYLYAYDTTTQIQAAPATFSFNTIIATHSISLVDNSKIYFWEKGLYNIQFSAQFDKTDSGDDFVDIWFRKNGEDIPWSNSQIHLIGNNAKSVPSWNFVGTYSVGDYAEIMWYSPDTDMRILSIASQSIADMTIPATPAIILTVWQIYSQYTK